MMLDLEKCPLYSFDVPIGSGVLAGGAKVESRSAKGLSDTIFVSRVPGPARLLLKWAPGIDG